MKFNGHFPKLMLSNLFFTDCFVQGSGKNNTATSVYDILKLYVKLHISAKNFRKNYFFFNDSVQCSCHPVHQSRYLYHQEQSSYLIIPEICSGFVNHWQTLQQKYRTCYKQIRWPHTSNILDTIFHSITAAYFWLQNFKRKLLKERNLHEIFVKEQCFEKKCFDNKAWKEFSLAMDRPMFPNMSKTFCNLETRNMKFNRCFFKSFHWVMLAFWQIDMCKDWKKSA